MATTTTTTVVSSQSQEEPLTRCYSTFSLETKFALDPAPSAVASSPAPEFPRSRRRHSSYHAHFWLSEEDISIQLLVDRFLAELGRRLDFLENYAPRRKAVLNFDLQDTFDKHVERAWSTLQAVRESCSRGMESANMGRDGVIDAGRRRARILVEVLEERYKGALARKDTMEQKVQEAVRLSETLLSNFEKRAYALRDSRLVAAGEFLDVTRRRVDSGLGRAKGVADDSLAAARRAKTHLKAKIDAAIALAREKRFIRYEDLPEPWRANPHIRRGYRFTSSYIECFRSTLILTHNESFNIWSHLIGLVIILATAFCLYPHTPEFTLSTTSDVAVATLFFLAAAKCLFCSTLWHTMSCISEVSLMERFACVDYTGISFLVATSILTTEYTAFYCDPTPRWLYMTFTALLGIGGTLLPWHPYFNHNDRAWLRVVFYVSLASTGAAPALHVALVRGTDWAAAFYAPIAKSLLVYLVGALLYALKVPERWFPGCFDYIGGSHNIWHVAVLGGILFHYTAMQEFFRRAFEMAGVGAAAGEATGFSWAVRTCARVIDMSKASITVSPLVEQVLLLTGTSSPVVSVGVSAGSASAMAEAGGALLNASGQQLPLENITYVLKTAATKFLQYAAF